MVFRKEGEIMIPLLLIALLLWVINLCMALSLPNEHSAPATAVAASLHLRGPGLALWPPRGGEKLGLLALMARMGSVNVLVHLWAFSCLVIVQGNQFPQNDLSRWAVEFFSWFSPLIFLLWDTLSVWDLHVEDSVWSRRKNLLCLSWVATSALL